MKERITVEQVLQGYAKSGLQPRQGTFYRHATRVDPECCCAVTAALLNDDDTLLEQLRGMSFPLATRLLSAKANERYGHVYAARFASCFDSNRTIDSFEDGEAFEDGLAARRAVFGEAVSP